jgi:hypothetical protein
VTADLPVGTGDAVTPGEQLVVLVGGNGSGGKRRDRYVQLHEDLRGYGHRVAPRGEARRGPVP